MTKFFLKGFPAYFTLALGLAIIILFPQSSIATNATNATCRTTQFQCDNGNCISTKYLCNGVNDCGNFTTDQFNGTSDDSDEDPYGCTAACQAKNATIKCGNQDCGIYTPHMLCPNCTKCIQVAWICDGVIDCPDGWDEYENHCTTWTDIATPSTTTEASGSYYDEEDAEESTEDTSPDSEAVIQEVTDNPSDGSGDTPDWSGDISEESSGGPSEVTRHPIKNRKKARHHWRSGDRKHKKISRTH